MKFQWYVIDTQLRTVEGTNDIEAIQPLVEDERYVLLTAQHGKYFNGSSADVDVRELCLSDEDAPDDPDDNDLDEDGSSSS